jgi:hypothetical protein
VDKPPLTTCLRLGYRGGIPNSKLPRGRCGGIPVAALGPAECSNSIRSASSQSGSAPAQWRHRLPTPEAAYGIPMMANTGVKEKSDRFARAWTGSLATFNLEKAVDSEFFQDA